MPTYDYECDACGHKFEQFQSIKDDPLTKCPACKKKKLRRLFGMGAALLFKGSGFYTTDYRPESYKKRAEADAKPAGDAPKSGEGTATTGKTESATPKSKDSGKSSSKND